jgi:di/tricarboxylate transporter
MWLTALVLLGILVLLAIDATGPDAIFGAALIVLLFGGVISPREALAGFSNQGMVTVGLLFIVSQAVQNTGVFTGIAEWLFAGTRGARHTPRRGLLLRLMAPVTVLSAVLNNTPIVTIFTPVVKRWAEALGVAPSRLLIPLSYAAILGGTWTLIGTSTNLVVHGLALDRGLAGFAFFELAKVGVPVAIVGYAYLALVGRRLLPDRRDTLAELETDPKQYVVELRVAASSPIAGKTIGEASLRNLPGVYLTDIERDGEHIGPVTPADRIHAGDRLIFAGKTDGLSDVIAIPGLDPVDQETFAADQRRFRSHLVEAVVSSSSPAAGRTIREYNFRSAYGAAVVALHRNGERIDGRLGDVRLQPGDTLVLLTHPDFRRRWRASRDFYLVSNLDRVQPEARRKGPAAVAIVSLMVVAAALGPVLPAIGGNRIGMFYAAAGAAVALVLLGTIAVGEARRALRVDILITIAAAFGVSTAILNSGLADLVAGGIVGAMLPFGAVGALAAVYAATSLFTELITNNAAAALMFPIALATADRVEVAPLPFLVAVAMAASASFATPIGYQTNLIVQGAGGYRFRDFLRVGLPLNALALVTGVAAIALWYGL